MTASQESQSINLTKGEKSVLLFPKESGYTTCSRGPAMVDEIVKTIRSQLPGDLLKEGVDCELLQAGASGWKKGKLQLRLQFVEDPGTEAEAPATPLDKLRQTQQQDNQPSSAKPLPQEDPTSWESD